LTVDSEGNIWAALQGPSQLARFNLQTKTFDRFASFSPGSGPIDVAFGPDGNIYATLQFINKLGQFDPRTGMTREFATTLGPLDGPSVDQLIVGPDGQSIFFNEFLNDRIGRFDIATQQITEFNSGITPNSAPLGMVVGPDGNVWFSEVSLNPVVPGRIARLQLGSPHELKIQLEVSTSPFGAPVTSVAGGKFWVNAYVEDLRDDADGVVGGVFDLLFASLGLDPTGNKQYGAAFTIFQQGAANDAGGLIDETGALTTSIGVGVTGRAAFVSWEFEVTRGVGSVTFKPEPGEGSAGIVPAEFALVGKGEGVPWDLVELVSATLTVLSRSGDFNGDGEIDQLDRDLLIAQLFIPATDSRYDVQFDLTGDGPVNHYDLAILTPLVAASAGTAAPVVPSGNAPPAEEPEPPTNPGTHHESLAAQAALLTTQISTAEASTALGAGTARRATTASHAAAVAQQAAVSSAPVETALVELVDESESSLAADLLTEDAVADAAESLAASTTEAAEIDAQQTALLELLLEVSGTPFGAAVTTWDEDTFWVNVYVEDLRDVPQGAVGGAFDLLFETAGLTPTGSVQYGAAFTLFRQGTADDSGGFIDEAGALTSSHGVGASGRAAFVAWEFQTTASGSVTFRAAPGEGTLTITPAEFALVGESVGVPWDEVEFVDATVELTQETGTGAISGFVYVDTNANRQFDASESPLRGVAITLNGSGDFVRTTTTDSAGAYRFEDLPPGTYQVREEHPIAFFDGDDQIGTGGGTAADDQFSGIVIEAGDSSSGNNYSEAGIRPQYFSRRMFLASSPPFVESLAALVQLGRSTAASAAPAVMRLSAAPAAAVAAERTTSVEKVAVRERVATAVQAEAKVRSSSAGSSSGGSSKGGGGSAAVGARMLLASSHSTAPVRSSSVPVNTTATAGRAALRPQPGSELMLEPESEALGPEVGEDESELGT
jgi:hypothetical protein